MALRIKRFLSFLSTVSLILLVVLSLGILAAPWLPSGFIPWLQVMPVTLPLWGTLLFFIALWQAWKGRKKIALGLGFLFLLSFLVVLKDFGWHHPKPDSSAAGLSFLLVSHNLRGFVLEKGRAEDAIALLAPMQADIICLQEFRNIDLEGEKALEYFARETGLPYYSYLHQPNHLLGTVVLSRFPIIAMDTLFLPPEEVNNGGIVTVETPAGRLGIGNVHISSFALSVYTRPENSPLQNAAAVANRIRRSLALQDAKARMIVSRLSDFPYPLILTGDFNMTCHSRLYRLYRSQFGDAFRAAGKGFGGTFPLWYRWGPRIDYHFFSPGIKPKWVERVLTEVSDHFPLQGSYQLLP